MTATERTTGRFAPGTFRPDPGRARPGAMVRAATAQELRIVVRNGEQLFLGLVVPVSALFVMVMADIADLPSPRVATVVPGILVLAVLSSAFTSQAIVTGFDRRYGVLRRLAATGFPHWLLLTAKSLVTAVMVAAQYLLLIVLALTVLDWSPAGNVAWVVLVTALGIAAFVGLALLLGGTLRAEAVLGLANLVWLILVGLGGVIIPLAASPTWLRVTGEATPSGAMSTALRAVLTDGAAPPVASLLILVGWLAVGWVGTMRYFRWQ